MMMKMMMMNEDGKKGRSELYRLSVGPRRSNAAPADGSAAVLLCCCFTLLQIFAAALSYLDMHTVHCTAALSALCAFDTCLSAPRCCSAPQMQCCCFAALSCFNTPSSYMMYAYMYSSLRCYSPPPALLLLFFNSSDAFFVLLLAYFYFYVAFLYVY